jgi:hypothetical protein
MSLVAYKLPLADDRPPSWFVGIIIINAEGEKKTRFTFSARSRLIGAIDVLSVSYFIIRIQMEMEWI